MRRSKANIVRFLAGFCLPLFLLLAVAVGSADAKEKISPFIEACRAGNLQEVKRLLDEGAKFDNLPMAGRKALVEATENRHLEVVRFLIQKGANVNIFDARETSALMWACKQGDLAIIKLLLSHGADVNAQNTFGRMALIYAIEAGNLEAVKLLLENGADANAANRQQKTVLAYASMYGHLEIVKALIEKGADIHAKDKRGNSVFLEACGSRKGPIDVVQFLFQKGAHIHTSNTSGETPLIHASRAGNFEIVKFLLENGADIKSSSKDGGTALGAASASGHIKIVKLLFEYGADIEVKNGHINYVFVSTCSAGRDPELLKFLLEKGADINHATRRFGRIGLIDASKNGHVETVTFLLENGADCNAADRYGESALMKAAKNGHIEVVKILLKNGADLEVKNNKGLTALTLAKNEKVRTILKRSGAKEATIIEPGNFDLIHSLPCDKRLVHGLKQAFSQYYRLLSRQPGALISVKATTTQLDAEHYQITYRAEIKGKTEQYRLTLSNQSRDIRGNIAALEKVIQAFAKKRKPLTRLLRKSAAESEGVRAQISELISRFDYIDLFKALQLVDHHISSGTSGPRLLFSAGEIYSWLAFFKNRNQNRSLSDSLATHAVCNYLLGCLDDLHKTDKPFYEGLLLLSLDYPAAAQEAFTKTHTIEELLSAFVKYDFETLKAFDRNPLINRRLLGYLRARAYYNSNQENVAFNHFNKLMLDYPDFLLAKEYVVDNGSVSISRRFMREYVEELLEKHLEIMNEFMQTDWVEQDKELELEVRKEVSKENRLLKWLKIHGAILKRPHEMKKYCRYLNPDFLNHYLKQDMANALFINYRLEAELLGRVAGATTVAEMAETAYPNTTISRVLNLKLRKEHGKAESDLRNVSLETADRFLVQTLFYLPKWSRRQDIYYLRKYREKENPDSVGLYRLFEFYEKLFYRPCALNCLKAALDADPYNFNLYEKILNYEEGKGYIDKGKSHIGHLYGFLVTVAAWQYKNGNKEEAISYYKEAIDKSPAQATAYRKLGEIYQSDKKYEEAIEMWSRYLKHDDSSLSAVAIKNAMGRTWLERGENSKAYDIFLESMRSGHEGALLGFAEASEKTGKILQAEKYYQKAARRYPQSGSPAKLGLFYLRQNNPDMAYEVFREYKRYHGFHYYFFDLIDYYTEIGAPEKAVDVVKKVEGEGSDIWLTCVRILADIYAARNQHKTAANLIKPFALNTRQTHFLRRYWKFSIEGKLSPPDEILSKILRRYRRIWPHLIQFGTYLVQNGFYDEGAKALGHIFNEKLRFHEDFREEILVSLAIAWRMGSRDPEVKEVIKTQLKEIAGKKWLTSRVLFLIGELDEQAIFQQANTQKKHGQIYCYLGIINHGDGKREQALRNLLVSLETIEERQEEYRYALDLAKRLAQ